MNLFTCNSPYHYLLKYLLFLLKHPVYWCLVSMVGHTVEYGRTYTNSRLRLKCDGTRAEIRFRLSAKRMSPFKSAGASVHSTTGSRGVRISNSNAGYTMFRGSVKSSGYPLYSPVFPSLALPFVTVCHHITTGLYLFVMADHM
jgi:hypothetical protein